MISLLRRLYHRINTMNALNKIINEMDADYKELEKDFLALRTRCKSAEAELLTLRTRTTDQGIKINMCRAQMSMLPVLQNELFAAQAQISQLKSEKMS